ncbi:MAG TPA: proton-conducting transporter membrane subunit [Pseudonocardiaceae bacterium]|jgi:formate hydrogenlyase subunit 3/multisubunit Na+/H+ antiporter MnhD subunit|nr:proton-conducting transporter membrane subunit [Pseudonocardiaceae bacterium]
MTNPTADLLIAGLAVLAVAVVLDLAVGVRNRFGRLAPHLLCVVADVVLVVAGARAVAGLTGRVSLDHWLAFGTEGLTLDRLSGLFLTIAAGVGIPVALVFASWSRSTERLHRRGLGALHALTLAAVVAILTADNAFVLYFAWESLTVLFYLLAGFARRRPGRAHASVLTIGVSKTGGAALLIGLLLLATHANSYQLADFSTVHNGLIHGAAYALLLLAFAAKVGLVPVQTWMPEGYAAAPGPVRALMAGVAALVGFYGMWRTLDLLGAPPIWLIIVVLLLGGITALLGIAHTTVQEDLRRVIAYSSVENAGLIVTGFGVALVGSAAHLPALQAAGLLAATLQAIAHAVAKSALFSATATFEVAEGTTLLGSLRGLGRRMPFSGAAFGIGALTLAGLPPTAGFVSEWFLLEALMQQFRLSGLDFRLPLALAGALVALTAGFAAVAFVRVLGLVVLGSRDRTPVTTSTDAGTAGRVGLVALAVACIGLAAITPLEIQFIASGISHLVPAATTAGASGPNWVLGPVFQHFSVLSPSWLAIELPSAAIVVLLLAVWISGGRLLAVRRVPPWRSATAGVAGENGYTPFGYATPTRRVLSSILLTRSRAQTLEGLTAEARTEIDPRAADHPTAVLRYTVDVVELVDRYAYRPLLKPVRALATAATRLQSGRLDAYLLYMLIALVALLAVVAAMS